MVPRCPHQIKEMPGFCRHLGNGARMDAEIRLDGVLAFSGAGANSFPSRLRFTRVGAGCDDAAARRPLWIGFQRLTRTKLEHIHQIDHGLPRRRDQCGNPGSSGGASRRAADAVLRHDQPLPVAGGNRLP